MSNRKPLPRWYWFVVFVLAMVFLCLFLVWDEGPPPPETPVATYTPTATLSPSEPKPTHTSTPALPTVTHMPTVPYPTPTFIPPPPITPYPTASPAQAEPVYKDKPVVCVDIRPMSPRCWRERMLGPNVPHVVPPHPDNPVVPPIYPGGPLP